ncbi:MAG: hypothetical protein M1834_005131 [Cirrosporium novae-zelandiae]|nr:MAG: hypothetical protein M1834_005131 [Cirrosporium novae-zelandiae]
MASSTQSYSSDPALYLYTSLTAGSSHIITATSRLETILKANRIPFRAIDVATDEKARMLWGRRAGKRKLPGLVKMGMIVGDLEQIEEWNEYGELKENIGPVPDVSLPSASKIAPLKPTISHPAKAPEPAKSKAPEVVKATPGESSEKEKESGAKPEPAESSITLTLRRAGEEAAKIAKDGKIKIAEALKSPPSKSRESTTTEKPKAELDSRKAPEDTPSSPSPSAKAVVSSSPVPSKPPSSSERPQSSASRKSTEIDPETERWYERRGSSVSNASKEEIAAVEAKDKIPEEDEGADEAVDEAADDSEKKKAKKDFKEPVDGKERTQDQPVANAEKQAENVED